MQHVRAWRGDDHRVGVRRERGTVQRVLHRRHPGPVVRGGQGHRGAVEVVAVAVLLAGHHGRHVRRRGVLAAAVDDPERHRAGLGDVAGGVGRAVLHRVVAERGHGHRPAVGPEPGVVQLVLHRRHPGPVVGRGHRDRGAADVVAVRVLVAGDLRGHRGRRGVLPAGRDDGEVDRALRRGVARDVGGPVGQRVVADGVHHDGRGVGRPGAAVQRVLHTVHTGRVVRGGQRGGGAADVVAVGVLVPGQLRGHGRGRGVPSPPPSVTTSSPVIWWPGIAQK